MFQQTNDGVCFQVYVVPKSSRNCVIGWENDELKIRLAAVPEKGKANEKLIHYLAEVLGLGKSRVRLLRGEASRHKRICVIGMSCSEIEAKIKTEISMKESV